MFHTAVSGSTKPSLQPYNAAAATHGFPTIGDVLSQGIQVNICGANNSIPYDAAWIGKWHLSDFQFGASADPTGAGGPRDYGFTSKFSLPTPADTSIISGYSYPYANYCSPNGMQNEGTGGDNLVGGHLFPTFQPLYNISTTPSDPLDVYHGHLNIGPISGFTQLNDPAIYHAFHDFWLQDNHNLGAPWFLAVSFVNPHDMQNFPWAYGLATNVDGQACGGGLNDFGCATSGSSTGYYPPPVLGWTETYGADPSIQFNGLPYSLYQNTSTGFPLADWNYPDRPEAMAYNGGFGKPDMQASFQFSVAQSSGSVNDTVGWCTFLNYYYWMQATVDTLIGQVLYDIRNTSNAPNLGTPPIIIFTSDHGDYGGSHSLHAKGGALYDEVINVPLMIHSRGQHNTLSRDFVCSSVDLLPYIYSAAIGNESWRNATDMVSYLSYRESIYDSIVSSTPNQRRLAPYLNHIGSPSVALPYVLHTTDEFPFAPKYNGSGIVPPHAIAFRTVDNTYVGQQANGFMNFYGGGKLGMYTYWLPCTTFPQTVGPSVQPQFEFYDYNSNNYGEKGNDAFTNGVWNSATAGLYLNSYNNIMKNELYEIYPKIANAYNTAFTAYMTYLGGFYAYTGSNSSCNWPLTGPNTIPAPS